MKKHILNFLGQTNDRSPSLPDLLRALKLPPRTKKGAQPSTFDRKNDHDAGRVRGQERGSARHAVSGSFTGRIQITRSGRGFVRPSEPGVAEIAIPSSSTGTAFHDDLVRVEVDERERSRSGRVIKVLERRLRQTVGTLRKEGGQFQVIPDDPRLPRAFSVRTFRGTGRKAQIGDKVLIGNLRWDSPGNCPEGQVVEVLGQPNAEGVDMLGLIRQYDLPGKFPSRVLKEVHRLGVEVTSRDREGRIDCRRDPVVTIDPADAKDFDDAFSLERVSGNRWKLRVHIADVSHYVKPGTAIDVEARKRGNSTYLVDRVLPMLPEALSNELCSLKPRVERLTKCVQFLLTEEGKVVGSEFYPAVIHSRRRYSYEEAMKVLECSPSNGLDRMLHDARRLAELIRKRRFRQGSLDLDFPESKIRLDARGRVARIESCPNDASHQLIEEFMLLANEAVAKELKRLGRPAVHRVHEHPDPHRLGEYRAEVLKRNVACGNLEKPAEVKKLLHRLRELPHGQALKIGFLRSLTRAGYSVEPGGHYGLAKEDYTHFTSPIRRYADLLVHRSLFSNEGGCRRSLSETAEHISSTERNSADAERDSRQIKIQAFLQQQIHVGKRQTYRAIVTEIRPFGLFIDITELGMNGVVPFSALREDHYEVDSHGTLARGRRSGRLIRFGDSIDVEIAKVDPAKKQVDFRFPAKNPQRPSTRRRRGKRVPAHQGKFAEAG